MTSAIITVTQGDFLYIDEWIQYHHNIGVDLFLIAYNGDHKNFDKLSKYDYVKYFDFSTNNQTNLFNEFDGKISKMGWVNFWSNTANILFLYLKTFFKDKVKYVALIDTDEFISPNEKIENITQYLDNIYNQNLLSEFIHMQFYNGDNHIYYEDKPVLKRFTYAKNNEPYDDGKTKGFKKSIINIQHNEIDNLRIWGFHDNSYSHELNNLPFDKIVLKHFFTKSLEEWIMKMDPYNDKDYFKRFKGKLFGNIGYYMYNDITEEGIKVIPNLLKKYNIDYYPEIEEIDNDFRNIYMKYNNIKLEDYMIWCTYHDKKLIDEFKLKESDTFKLFYTKKDLPNRYSINHLQQFLCEWVTQYYVWKNCIKTKYVGFCHYRRIINVDEDVLKTFKENNIYYHHYFPLRFAKCIKDEWLLGGLNLHVDLIKEYLQTKEKYNKYLDCFDYVMNNQPCMNFGELYVCKWDIFEELMEFIEDYIKFLFYKLFNIEYKELYEYSVEEHRQMAVFLNNINWNLFEQEHIKKGDWDPNNTPPFYGGNRSLAFMIEMVEGLFWELYKKTN